MVLLNAICNDLKHYASRNYAIIPEVQLLIALRYYATGAFQVSYIRKFLLNLTMTVNFYSKNIILRHALLFLVGFRRSYTSP